MCQKARNALLCPLCLGPKLSIPFVFLVMEKSSESYLVGFPARHRADEFGGYLKLGDFSGSLMSFSMIYHVSISSRNGSGFLKMGDESAYFLLEVQEKEFHDYHALILKQKTLELFSLTFPIEIRFISFCFSAATFDGTIGYTIFTYILHPIPM